MDLVELSQTIDYVNYKGVMLNFRYAYDHFKENGGGAFVINASYTASMTSATHKMFANPPEQGGGCSTCIYTSTKAAVTDMARSLGGCYAADNIHSGLLSQSRVV